MNSPHPARRENKDKMPFVYFPPFLLLLLPLVPGSSAVQHGAPRAARSGGGGGGGGRRPAVSASHSSSSRRPGVLALQGHNVGGLDVAAAGVIPFVRRRGQGVHFLMQTATNGTRAGLLSDFGGRREDSDEDAFETAARELTEETAGAFGDPAVLALRLRHEAKIRIINRAGRYVAFFLEVPYVHQSQIERVDTSTAEGATARECRWLRADQVIGEVERGHVFERLLQRPRSPTAAAHNGGGGESGWSEGSEPTSLHRALLKTLALDEVNPYAQERWHATVLSSIMQSWRRDEAAARREAEEFEALARRAALPAAALPAGAARSRRRGRRRGGGAGGGGGAGVPPPDLDYAP